MQADTSPTSAYAGRRTIVYIDGLNMYYGALKGTPYKWLDIEKLCSRLLPDDRIVAIKYYTARVKDTSNNPGAAQRQDVYLRALRTLEPLLSIHYGRMQMQKKWRYLASDRTKKVKVIENQEKQTDVNLASHLVWDASRRTCEKAAVISNDSDLRGAIRVVEERAGIPVTIVNPDRRGMRAGHLEATDYRTIRTVAIAESQFPEELGDSRGVFHKPLDW
ncbi:MAG: NYN domain-containing protein [bacterium]|nr:NYN domain-containing protein [bacterium]